MFSFSRSLRLAAIGTSALVAFAAQPAFAQSTDTENLTVSATIQDSCTVQTTAVAFGDVNVVANENIDNTGALLVTCTADTGWTATAGVGTGAEATFALRQMTDGTNDLNYTLYTDSGRTTVWGNGTDSGTLTGTGTGSQQSTTIYARIPSGQAAVPASTYSDTVLVTLTY